MNLSKTNYSKCDRPRDVMSTSCRYASPTSRLGRGGRRLKEGEGDPVASSGQRRTCRWCHWLVEGTEPYLTPRFFIIITVEILRVVR